MYPYTFRPKRTGINWTEIFVAMPYKPECDDIYTVLIVPAVNKANDSLGFNGHEQLKAYLPKYDRKTISGWVNILEHLFTAQIVLGVLKEDNANVFYELGIAHATQPETRQILIAEEGYIPKFDLKDLIVFYYKKDLNKSIESLASKIKDIIDWYHIEEDRRIRQIKMQIGPFEFEIMMLWNNMAAFAVSTSLEGRQAYKNVIDAKVKTSHGEGYGERMFETHLIAMSNLCRLGLLGLDTAKIQPGAVRFSYHWTDLGNCVLCEMGLIKKNELDDRRRELSSMPHFL